MVATPGVNFQINTSKKLILKDVIIISENFENVKSEIKEGSAESIVMRQKEARMRKSEQLMDDMKEDFPQLKNIYEMLKGRK